MNIPFIKIQNVGNDYIYIDKTSLYRRKIQKSSLAKKMCDRHEGVGSDGIFIVEKISPKSAFVEMFNSDGSSMEFCGNGIRGASLYLRDRYRSGSRSFAIMTRPNEYDVKIIRSSKAEQVARLRIGNPSFDSGVIGYSKRSKNCLGVRVKGDRKSWTLYCVAMPNPQAVIFVDNFDFEWQKEGRIIENCSFFKNRINVMFTRVDSSRKLTIKPWERGAGATLSCGSGAAAAVVISGLLGYTKGNVSVNMPGGVLKTEWTIRENAVYQEGASKIVCSGLYKF
ncbi:MAG: diaminopimelate epimerase [Candidatus Zixiibacteriota bacterium]|nr:MAG: diaminopimelate epimerase [candidate division Zixibacteria bacterium]